MVTEEIRKLQVETYKSNKNYKIEYSSSNTYTCCVVYFSSNAIFYPDTIENYQKSILEKDRYEFNRMKVKNADKHIFIRDIFKLWYAHGISPQYNTFEKISKLIKKKSEGYKSLIFIGISAGGYAATVLSTMLHVDMVLNFCGQWTMQYLKNREMRKLYEEGNENVVTHWNLNLEAYDNPNIFYFCSIKNTRDLKSLNSISHFQKVHIIKFYNSHHGVPFLKCTLPHVINMDYEQLSRLENKVHIPIFFDIAQVGIKKTIMCLYNEITKKIRIK